MSARSESNIIYGNGVPVRPADLNSLRADMVDLYAADEIPLDLSQRIPATGTWTVGTGGTLTESNSVGLCRVPVVLPTGTVITGVRVRGQQTGATDIFNCSLQSNNGTGSGSSPVGTGGGSDGVTVGAQQNIFAVPGNHATLTDTRYFVSISNSGGGTGNRIITGAYLTVLRPRKS